MRCQFSEQSTYEVPTNLIVWRDMHKSDYYRVPIERATKVDPGSIRVGGIFFCAEDT